MKTFGIIIAVTAALALAGCMFQKINEQDMLGKYRAELPGGGTDTLELLAQGECRQEIHLANGNSYNANGTWKYFDDTRYLQIRGIRESLTPEREINPNLAAPPAEQLLATPASRGLLGDIVIMLHEGIDYRRVR